jgi:hypothetical protein
MALASVEACAGLRRRAAKRIPNKNTAREEERLG